MCVVFNLVSQIGLLAERIQSLILSAVVFALPEDVHFVAI